ncbi:hypothetical protein [Cytobacillus firmus]|uniref:hypothetical protein n=1 Tax=Cytobacillus firmus TaxID=1399 RepID=UPI001C958141|nr:hypothetical protein [Cytobacillus firmus]MBY6051746.1 hypothetical protein [Cytobacillus firmus]
MEKSDFSPFLKLVTSCVMAVAVTVSSFSGVAGAEEEKVEGVANHIATMAESFEEQTDNVSEKTQKDLIKFTKKHLQKEKVLSSIAFNDLDFKSSIVKSLDNGDFFVKVASKGESDVEKFNGVSLTLNSSKEVTSTFEVILKETSDKTAELQTYLDGDRVTDVTLNKPDVEPQWSWSYFNDCLASQGIAWSVIAALGVLCGAACLFTAGAACVGCLYAGAAGSGGTIGWCIGQALKK